MNNLLTVKIVRGAAVIVPPGETLPTLENFSNPLPPAPARRSRTSRIPRNARKGIFLPSEIQFFNRAFNAARASGANSLASLNSANEAVANASTVLRVFWGK